MRRAAIGSCGWTLRGNWDLVGALYGLDSPPAMSAASSRKVPQLRAGRVAALWGMAALAAGCASDVPTETQPVVESPAPTGPEPVEPDFGISCAPVNPVPNEGRLLTRLQYDNTVRDLFRGLVTQSFGATFPPENRVLGFETNAELHRATAWLAEAHVKASEAIAGQLVGQLTQLLPCADEVAQAATQDAAAARQCASTFIGEYGPRAFRRPLLDAEVEPFVALYDQAAAERGFAHGIQLVIEALLQSPQFLYRFELDASRPVEPSSLVVEGAEVTGPEPSYALDGYEMASRLSYFLWNSMPDDELFAAAANDELVTAEQVEAQARRMVDDSKMAATLGDFHRQWLELDRLPSMVRELPGVGEMSYGPDWAISVDLFMHDVFSRGTNVESMMESPYVFMNPRLAGLYGVALPEGTPDNEFVPIAFEEDKRAGLITQPGLLAMLAHSNQSAPIQRGVFIRTSLLCQPPPPPPPSVDPTPPDPDPNATTRERFAQHTADTSCAGCHALIDPIGLGLENFDQLGRYRADENGLPVDPSGAILATREEALAGEFYGGQDLAQRLEESQQFKDCLVTQWYRYASGRVEQTVDLCSMAQARAAFEKSEGNLREMVIAMAISDGFRYRTESAPVDVSSADGASEVQP